MHDAGAVDISGQLTTRPEHRLVLPQLIADAGDDACRRYVEFFLVTIRNTNTRAAYGRAASAFFAWCKDHSLALTTVNPLAVAAYVEGLQQTKVAPSTVKQHLAAIRVMFDWLVTGQVVPVNPATSVRGPRHVVKKGKTPVLLASETRQLFDSIDTSSIMGLRDRALIAVMVYSFARIGAATAMQVSDYYAQGKRWWLRLHEKGGRFHEVPAHHTAEAYLDTYLEAAALTGLGNIPLFQTVAGRSGRLTGARMSRRDALAMIKRRAAAAGLPRTICNHTFRGTGITVYLQGGGTLEKAQAIAGHESPRTTKLYDRTVDQISLDEIERIVI